MLASNRKKKLYKKKHILNVHFAHVMDLLCLLASEITTWIETTPTRVKMKTEYMTTVFDY